MSKGTCNGLPQTNSCIRPCGPEQCSFQIVNKTLSNLYLVCTLHNLNSIKVSKKEYPGNFLPFYLVFLMVQGCWNNRRGSGVRGGVMVMSSPTELSKILQTPLRVIKLRVFKANIQWCPFC